MKSILLVDDDEHFTYIIKKMLKKINFQGKVEEAANGQAALDLLVPRSPENLPDYIFLDINMPGVDGFEFLKKFKPYRLSSPKRITITMVTSSIDERDVNRSKEYGADYYLIKPITTEDLSRILSRTMSAQ